VKSRSSNPLVVVACVAAAIAPAALVALPAHDAVVEARAAEASTEIDDAAQRLFELRRDYETLAREVLPALSTVGDAIDDAAPRFDADGDRVLELLRSAREAGVDLKAVRPDPAVRTEREGYRFHAIEIDAVGATTKLAAFLDSMESGARRSVVLWARLSRGEGDVPTTTMTARFLFSERTTAPEPVSADGGLDGGGR
jgi:hypothetical protein